MANPNPKFTLSESRKAFILSINNKFYAVGVNYLKCLLNPKGKMKYYFPKEIGKEFKKPAEGSPKSKISGSKEGGATPTQAGTLNSIGE